MTKHRSAASLLASGVATITIDQRLRIGVRSTAAALRNDRDAIAADSRRALRRVVNSLAG